MCVSARGSLISFFTNLFSCAALVKFGNQNLYFYNLVFASILMFVSLMQLVDYGMWIDLECKLGTNKIASIAGPILNHLQPLVIFVITFVILNYSKVGKEFYKNNLKIQEGGVFDHFNIGSKKLNFIKALNIFHVLIIVILLGMYYYKAFTTNPELLCTKVCEVDNTLDWKWYKKITPVWILVFIWHIYIINHISINPRSNYIKLTLIFFYILLFASKYLKSKSGAELWCYIINFAALFLLIAQKSVPENCLY